MPHFEVGAITALNRMPEAWWGAATIVEGERETEIHFLIPDRGQEEPSAESIEAELRSRVGEADESAIDRLADLARPYYGVRHRVVRLS